MRRREAVLRILHVIADGPRAIVRVINIGDGCVGQYKPEKILLALVDRDEVAVGAGEEQRSPRR